MLKIIIFDYSFVVCLDSFEWNLKLNKDLVI